MTYFDYFFDRFFEPFFEEMKKPLMIEGNCDEKKHCEKKCGLTKTDKVSDIAKPWNKIDENWKKNDEGNYELEVTTGLDTNKVDIELNKKARTVTMKGEQINEDFSDDHKFYSSYSSSFVNMYSVPEDIDIDTVSVERGEKSLKLIGKSVVKEEKNPDIVKL